MNFSASFLPVDYHERHQSTITFRVTIDTRLAMGLCTRHCGYATYEVSAISSTFALTHIGLEDYMELSQPLG